jgi:hypothetical protein
MISETITTSNKSDIDRHATLAMTGMMSCLGGEEGGEAAFLSTHAILQKIVMASRGTRRGQLIKNK